MRHLFGLVFFFKYESQLCEVFSFHISGFQHILFILGPKIHNVFASLTRERRTFVAVLKKSTAFSHTYVARLCYTFFIATIFGINFLRFAWCILDQFHDEDGMMSTCIG